MDIFTRLTNDHRLISRVLDAFEHFLSDAAEADTLSRVELYRFCTFFREFVELSHHDVEEGVLFPAMVQVGYSWNGGPLTHVRNEHERERRLLFELRRQSLEPAFSAKERAEVIRVGCDLIAFQRAHMKKESELLYPAVQKEFATKELHELDADAVKQNVTGARDAEERWLLTLAEELIADHPSTQRPAADTAPASATNAH